MWTGEVSTQGTQRPIAMQGGSHTLRFGKKHSAAPVAILHMMYVWRDVRDGNRPTDDHSLWIRFEHPIRQAGALQPDAAVLCSVLVCV